MCEKDDLLREEVGIKHQDPRIEAELDFFEEEMNCNGRRKLIFDQVLGVYIDESE